MNVIRSMLDDKQVPKIFYSEAARWCLHIQNWSPTLAVENKTSEEAWSGEKLVVKYF